MYKEYSIFDSLEDLLSKNLVKIEKLEVMKEFLVLTVTEVYEYYISSKRYLKDIENIHKKEGEKYAVLFSFISQNFIKYYSLSRGNRQNKKNKEN